MTIKNIFEPDPIRQINHITIVYLLIILRLIYSSVISFTLCKTIGFYNPITVTFSKKLSQVGFSLIQYMSSSSSLNKSFNAQIFKL